MILYYVRFFGQCDQLDDVRVPGSVPAHLGQHLAVNVISSRDLSVVLLQKGKQIFRMNYARKTPETRQQRQKSIIFALYQHICRRHNISNKEQYISATGKYNTARKHAIFKRAFQYQQESIIYLTGKNSICKKARYLQQGSIYNIR